VASTPCRHHHYPSVPASLHQLADNSSSNNPSCRASTASVASTPSRLTAVRNYHPDHGSPASLHQQSNNSNSNINTTATRSIASPSVARTDTSPPWRREAFFPPPGPYGYDDDDVYNNEKKNEDSIPRKPKVVRDGNMLLVGMGPPPVDLWTLHMG
jgi:hypothetical protein